MRKFSKNEQLRVSYTEFLKEYETLGHMTDITHTNLDRPNEGYYLPHHAVIKETSSTTKIQESSLLLNNSQWLKGPTWLALDEAKWDTLSLPTISIPEQRRNVALLVSQNNNYPFERFSSIIALTRFVVSCLSVIKKNKAGVKLTGELTATSYTSSAISSRGRIDHMSRTCKELSLWYPTDFKFSLPKVLGYRR